MAFANLQITLSADVQNLQTQLEKAQAISDAAFAKLQRSADGAGQAIGDAANAADFNGLSASAQAAAKSIDDVTASATKAGSATATVNDNIQKQLEQLNATATDQANKVSTGTKIAVAAGVAAIGYGLVQIGEFAAAMAFRFVGAAVDVAKFTAGLVTGENLQSKYIDSLIAANDRVKDLQVSLGLTATSASALELALARIGTTKGDYSSVYTATESAIRKAIQAQNDLQAKLHDARATGDTDSITKAETAVNDYTNAFERLGVKYKDEKGNVLDYQTIIQNASKVLDNYTAGYDRNAAASELGIGAAKQVGDAAKVNSESFTEAAKRQQDYFLVVGPGTQAAVAEYQQAMRLFRSESDLTSEGFKRAIADATIPILTELANLFKEGLPEAVGIVRGALTGIVTVFEGFELSAKALYEIVAFAFAGIELGATASLAAVNKALHFDFTGAKKEVDEGAKAIEARFDLMNTNLSHNLDKALAAIDLASGKDSQNTPVQNEKPAGGSSYTPPPTATPKAAAASSAAIDVQKKLLEQQLKTLDLFIGDEKELLQGRDEFLSLYYQHGDVAITDYFAYRQNAQAEYVTNTKKAYNEEIADLEAYIAKTKGNGNLTADQSTARVTDAQTKIIEVRNKLRKVEADANQETLKDWFANRTAVEQYGDQLHALVSQISSNQGDTAAAFEIDFEQQNRLLKRQLGATLNSDSSSDDDKRRAAQGLIDLDQLHEQGAARAKLNDLSTARNVILGDLANMQDRVDLAVSRGSKSELQGLADTSAANAARLDSLQKIADAYDTIAERTGNLQDQITADASHVALEKLRSQTNLVADAFNDAGKSVTENFFDKLTSGTVSARDAFKSLLADINSRILKLGSNALGDALFGKDNGLLSGLGKSVSSFFPASAGAGALSGAAVQASKSALTAAGTATSAGGASVAAANDAAFTALTATVTASDTALTALGVTTPLVDSAFTTLGASAAIAAAAIDALAAASSTSAASTAGSAIAKVAAASAKGNVFLGGNVIPFALGGVISHDTVVPMARMGEAGPEAILPLRRGKNGAMGVAMSGVAGAPALHVTNNFAIPPGTSTQTQAQIASKAYSGAARAFARNG